MRKALVFIAFTVAAIIVIVCFASGFKAHATLPRMEPLTATYTADDDVIKAYVIVDPDTAIQYIVTDHGGITPRLNK